MIIARKKVEGLTESALARFTSRARRATGLRGQVNVVLTRNSELRALNRRFRGKDTATDVLSFSAMPMIEDHFAGEIVISTNIARQNARGLGHSLASEIKILLLHGLLHLAGYDHETDGGKMARKEARLRRQLNLPASLTERAHGGHKR